MHDSVKGSGAKRNNRLYENVWIECKERVYRRDEYRKREGCGPELSHTV